MLNIINLILSKAIRDYLISIDYKFDARDVFGITCKFGSYLNKKQLRECLQLVLNNCDDEKLFDPNGIQYDWAVNAGYGELKCHSFVRDIIKRIDSIKDDKIALWEVFPDGLPPETFGFLVPLPFNEGDILYLHFPNNDSETEDLIDKPLLIRRLKKKSITNVINERIFTDEFTYFKYDNYCDAVVEYGMEGRYGLNYWNDMIYHLEFYSGDYDNKSLILKEMSGACKNNELDEFLNKNTSKIWTIENFVEQYGKKFGKEETPF
ncbi:MAG: hypothetical protein IJ593_00240 [Lachnospiraceae bacterium]|nr:hypothetical protein [Lachnospiraceae bacterium]